LCDKNRKCAAASYSATANDDECLLYKFGFEQVSGVNDSTIYIKPEVRVGMSSLDNLTDTFSIVKQHTRLYHVYDGFDALTPFECFEACRASSKCGGAAFTVDIKSVFNCNLSPVDGFTMSNAREADAFLWTVYIKSERVAVASTVNGKRGGNEFWISYAKAESSSIV
jgi:hypothetical protein